MNVALFCAVVQIKSYLWYLKMYFAVESRERKGENQKISI